MWQPSWQTWKGQGKGYHPYVRKVERTTWKEDGDVKRDDEKDVELKKKEVESLFIQIKAREVVSAFISKISKTIRTLQVHF